MDSVLDIFSGDAFGVQALTKAISRVPYAPRFLGSLNLFEKEGVSTKSVILEREGSTIQVLPTKARGAAGTKYKENKRTARSFEIPHIPHDDEIHPDSISGVREFDSSNQLQAINRQVNKHLAGMRNNHEVTWEWHRVGAVQGDVKDADGTTLFNLFTEFGITEVEVFFDLDNSTDVLASCTEVVRAMEDALGSGMYTGILGLCGNSFWDKFVANSSVKTAFERYQEGSFLRGVEDRVNLGFEFGGINFKNYRGSIGGTPFIPTDVCRFIPLGLQNTFKHFSGPADFNEAVNTIGKEIYARQEPRKFGRGVDIHTQSNPLIICRQPNILIKGDEAAS